MKYYPSEKSKELSPELLENLKSFQEKRGFDPAIYVQAKAWLINSYFKKFNLKGCVLGLSDGINSNIVLAILKHTQYLYPKTILKILPISVPNYNDDPTIQEKTAEKILENSPVTQELISLDISKPIKQIVKGFKKETDFKSNLKSKFLKKEMVAYFRTPIFYFATSLLSEENIPSVVCGTTNKDEGAYLGGFKKASDAMVDLQIISDLHKSEVYQIAEYLKLSPSLLQNNATKNTEDAEIETKTDVKTDVEKNNEELFEIPDKFVELYLHFLDLEELEKTEFLDNLSNTTKKEFQKYQRNIEKLHQNNSHKYLSKSPAFHLDIQKSDIKNGWEKTPYPQNINKNLVNQIQLNNFLNQKNQLSTPPAPIEITKIDLTNDVYKLTNALLDDEIKNVTNQLKNKVWLANGNDVLGKGQNSLSKNNQKNIINSWKCFTYNEKLADNLWTRLSEYIPDYLYDPEIIIETNLGLFEKKHLNGVWKKSSLNPLFRFIKYEKDGIVIPHYELNHSINRKKKTFFSVLFHLAEGTTRLIKDNKTNSEFHHWNRLAKSNEVLSKFNLLPGDCLVIPHYKLFDNEKVETQNKIIIRTDIFYEQYHEDF